MRYWIVITLWIAYCAVHSILIANPVTRFFKKVLGSGYRYYRLLYVSFSLATLVPLLSYSNSTPARPLFQWAGSLIFVQYAMIISGILLFVAGFWRYDILEFFGIRQLRINTAADWSGYGKLEKSGILGIIRHPLYVGLLVLIWSENLDSVNLAVNSIITVYVIIGTLLEERKLLLDLGEAYRQYQMDVSMFIPLKWLRSRIKS